MPCRNKRGPGLDGYVHRNSQLFWMPLILSQRGTAYTFHRRGADSAVPVAHGNKKLLTPPVLLPRTWLAIYWDAALCGLLRALPESAANCGLCPAPRDFV